MEYFLSEFLYSYTYKEVHVFFSLSSTKGEENEGDSMAKV
jgi:hypothetical protein